MSTPGPRAPVIELLEWVVARPRTYADAIEAWTSNCPRHPAWDDAMTDRLIKVVQREVTLTERGRAFLVNARG